VSVRFDAKQLQKALRALTPEFNAATAERLPDEGRTLLEKANASAPVKTGALRASGFVSSEASKTGARVAVGYTAEYAPMVHELAADDEHRDWFKKAFDAFEGEFNERVTKMLQRSLDDAVTNAGGR